MNVFAFAGRKTGKPESGNRGQIEYGVYAIAQPALPVDFRNRDSGWYHRL
jgi:hypothetical protein